MNHLVYLSIGSNLGDKLENCRESIRRLNEDDRIAVECVSRFYTTAPVDYLDQDTFVNAAVRIRTDLAPMALLEVLQGIQRQMGQHEKEIRFGPRIIDLDIIFYDRIVLGTEALTVPHPRMHERAFVLVPLCDIDDSFCHPVLEKSLKELLSRVDTADRDVLELT